MMTDGTERTVMNMSGIGSLVHEDPIRKTKGWICMYRFMLERIGHGFPLQCRDEHVTKAIASLKIGCMEPNKLDTATDGL